MTETRNGQQKELELDEQNQKEMLLNQLADTLELVAEGDAEISDLESCLGCFDEADLPDVDAEQALAHFREKHHVLMSEDKAFKEPTRQHPTRKYFRKVIAVVAAAVCFSTMYIAGASDEGITKMIGRWTEETFHFGGIGKEGETSITADDISLVVEGEYDTIETALAECEIPESAYPQWIPERFLQEKVSVRQANQRFCAVRARYSNTDGEVCIIEIMRFYQISDASSYVFEKDGTPVIEYEQDGVTHYLLKNPAGNSAVWNDGDLICSIVGDLSTEEFKSIINSIDKE